MHEFAFAANEYVAACGDGGKNYIFECNAAFNLFERLPSWLQSILKVANVGAEDLQIGGSVYFETNGEAGLQNTGSNQDAYRSDYHACYEKHETNNLGDFKDGWLSMEVGYGDYKHTFDTQQVIIWTGEDGKNTHCTTNLDMNEWEIAKS